MRTTSELKTSYGRRVLSAIFALSVIVVAPHFLYADRDNNPPGPRGGARTNWENPRGPQGGPGAGPNVGGGRRDFDNNRPGPAGGPGTNWENPMGPQGGPGAGPDFNPFNQSGEQGGGSGFENRQERFGQFLSEHPHAAEKMDANQDGQIDQVERQRARHEMIQRRREMNSGSGSNISDNGGDIDNNPPGAFGGPGTNWENQPGSQGGPGAGPDRMGQRRDRDNNPPGGRGGRGTNWENRSGPQGGPGAGPNVNHPGAQGRGAGSGAGPNRRAR